MTRHLSISDDLALVVDRMRKEMTNPYTNNPVSHTEALSSLIGEELLRKYGED
jgi:hypothetical protein